MGGMVQVDGLRLWRLGHMEVSGDDGRDDGDDGGNGRGRDGKVWQKWVKGGCYVPVVVFSRYSRQAPLFAASVRCFLAWC